MQENARPEEKAVKHSRDYIFKSTLKSCNVETCETKLVLVPNQIFRFLQHKEIVLLSCISERMLLSFRYPLKIDENKKRKSALNPLSTSLFHNKAKQFHFAFHI